MRSRLKVPKLGMAMSEGTIVEWLVAQGAEVTVGQPLYLIETDKAQTEINSPVAGRITLIGKAGETYEVGAIIAQID